MKTVGVQRSPDFLLLRQWGLLLTRLLLVSAGKEEGRNYSRILASRRCNSDWRRDVSSERRRRTLGSEETRKRTQARRLFEPLLFGGAQTPTAVGDWRSSSGIPAPVSGTAGEWAKSIIPLFHVSWATVAEMWFDLLSRKAAISHLLEQAATEFMLASWFWYSFSFSFWPASAYA